MMIIVPAVIGVVRLAVAILFSVVALYAGLSTFNHLTGGFDAPGELRKGNCAVGVLIFSVFLGISLPVYAGVQAILSGLFAIAAEGVLTPDGILHLALVLVLLLVTIVLAIGSVYFAMYLVAQVSPTMDVLREIKYGNTAVAVGVAGVILAVCIVVQLGVTSLFPAVLS
ncbi:DUF350 domain-containing protein [Methanoregula sp.]|uniref:DUF350 domain-containing protein n=1 Tax=Methanoregula sp. TaxID=2052170 RepID=UPI002C6F7BE7|nr:DUF350 domain-containing protein [Methanoregula sp.]HVP96802.1 DUF350 domain-containing protein [Methanoregula sp.]